VNGSSRLITLFFFLFFSFFAGKTMSLLVSNFWAEVTLIPNDPNYKELEAITILPNPVSDPHKFSSMECLVGVSEIDGYETGDRLLQACCKVFYRYCQENQINIDTRQGFRMMFETNIPRQVGLAGSSAIITALWKMLTLFYGVTEKQIPLELQASLVLKVEQDELGIAAGLQDRVIQVCSKCVYL
jgi:glucuronokinase